MGIMVLPQHTGILFFVITKLHNMGCPVCGFEMQDMSACHRRCYNCGAELDCGEGMVDD